MPYARIAFGSNRDAAEACAREAMGYVTASTYGPSLELTAWYALLPTSKADLPATVAAGLAAGGSLPAGQTLLDNLPEWHYSPDEED